MAVAATNETIALVTGELNERCTETEQVFYFWAFVAVIAVILVPFLVFLMLCTWIYYGLKRDYFHRFPHYKAIPQVARTGPMYYIAFFVPEAIIFNGLPYFFCASLGQRLPILFAASLVVYNLCAYVGFFVLWIRQNGLFARPGGLRDRLNRKEAWPYLLLGFIATAPLIAVFIGVFLFIAAVNEFEAKGENMFVNYEFCALPGEVCRLNKKTSELAEYVVVQSFASGLYSLDFVTSLPTGGTCSSVLVTPSFCVNDSREDFLSIPLITLGFDIVPIVALVPILFLPFITTLFYAWELISFHIRL